MKKVYRLQKKFTCPIGHRLSLHKGNCKNVHGHSFSVIITLKSNQLDNNDMVMDFSDLKRMVNKYIDQLDHGIMLNKNDPLCEKLESCSEKVTKFDADPTAETLSEYLYYEIKNTIESKDSFIEVESITVFENENSSITFSEEE
ncbi:MAG: 6-pyruvoyl trahydropterin synthase family protein [bacterium]